MKKLDVPQDDIQHNYLDDEAKRLLEDYNKKTGAG